MRTREPAVYARRQQRLEADVELDDAGSLPPPDRLKQSREAQDESPNQEVLSRKYGPSEYAGQHWHQGGNGVEIAWWPKGPRGNPHISDD